MKVVSTGVRSFPAAGVVVRHAPLFPVHRVATALTIAALTWGALAFGAVYPWGYWPLAAMALLAGALPLASGVSRTFVGESAFPFSLLAVAVVLAVQLVPLPLPALTALNPNAIELLHRLDPAFALSPAAHPLSVWPQGTRIALTLFAGYAVLMLGSARLMSETGARQIAGLLIVVGVVLALAGIVQKPLYNGKIYGFWTTIEKGSPFGPFVNRNHFAGWMLMALPVALGYFFASLARAMRGVRPDWHHRLLWLSSPDANKLIMASIGIAIMGLALVLTMSRSGIGALAVALGIMGWFALRRLSGRSRKAIAGGYLVLLVVLSIGLAGAESFVTRFSESTWDQFAGRTGAWTDAAATFKRHWLTGTGLNTYQVVNLVYQQHDTRRFVSAAHNDYVQLAAEGGIVLLTGLASCIALFAMNVRRRFAEDGESSAYWLRAGAVTGILAIGIQEFGEFSLQMPGNAALFAVVCGIALHKTPERRASPADFRFVPRRVS